MALPTKDAIVEVATGVEGVRTTLSSKLVASVSASDRVFAAAPGDHVSSCTADERVVVSAPDEAASRLAPAESVATGAAADLRPSGGVGTDDQVSTGVACEHDVAPFPSVDARLARKRVERERPEWR